MIDAEEADGWKAAGQLAGDLGRTTPEIDDQTRAVHVRRGQLGETSNRQKPRIRRRIRIVGALSERRVVEVTVRIRRPALQARSGAAREGEEPIEHRR